MQLGAKSSRELKAVGSSNLGVQRGANQKAAHFHPEQPA